MNLATSALLTHLIGLEKELMWQLTEIHMPVVVSTEGQALLGKQCSNFWAVWKTIETTLFFLWKAKLSKAFNVGCPHVQTGLWPIFRLFQILTLVYTTVKILALRFPLHLAFLFALCEQRGSYYQQEAKASYAALIWCFCLFGGLTGCFKQLSHLKPWTCLSFVAQALERLQRKHRPMAFKQVTQRNGNRISG